MLYCQICGKKVVDGTVPFCVPCLNAESIILHGKDLNGNGRAITAQDKVKMLISFDWKQGN